MADRTSSANRRDPWIERDDRKPGPEWYRFYNGRMTGRHDAISGAWPVLKLDPSLFRGHWNRGYVMGYLEGSQRESET